MPRQRFAASLNDVVQLLDLADAVASRQPEVSYLRLKLDYQPLLSGALVLLCARFEEFLREVIIYAFDQLHKADPPISLSSLEPEVGLFMFQQNITIALRKQRYGVERSIATRLNDSQTVAGHFTSDRIWSDFAIDTGGNPGPETVTNLIKLVGVDNPWKKIGEKFSSDYIVPQIAGAIGRAISKPDTQLGKIMDYRNSVAHSSAHVPLSSADLRFEADFINQLTGWIYDVLKDRVESFSMSRKSIPALWNPK